MGIIVSIFFSDFDTNRTNHATNLQRRLTEHFHGQSKATAPRRPFRLIFCEYYLSESDARRREGYLKTTAGRKGLKLILRETLTSRVWD